MTDKVLSSLSIAKKAGAVLSGEFQTENGVKQQEAFLVLIAADASDNTKKKFHDLCAYAQVPVREYGTREALGRCIGREFIASLAVTDERLAALVERAF